jgi:hypothetical protein
MIGYFINYIMSLQINNDVSLFMVSNRIRAKLLIMSHNITKKYTEDIGPDMDSPDDYWKGTFDSECIRYNIPLAYEYNFLNILHQLNPLINEECTLHYIKYNIKNPVYHLSEHRDGKDSSTIIYLNKTSHEPDVFYVNDKQIYNVWDCGGITFYNNASHVGDFYKGIREVLCIFSEH